MNPHLMNSLPQTIAAEPVLAKVNLLVAEDEALIALSLADLLEEEGYQVTLAGDGAEALSKAREMGDELDGLVTDLNMPAMRGEELIQELRCDRPELPVVVVTGSPPEGGVEQLRRDGGGHGPLELVEKPIDYDELLDTLRQVIPPEPKRGSVEMIVLGATCRLPEPETLV